MNYLCLQQHGRIFCIEDNTSQRRWNLSTFCMILSVSSATGDKLTPLLGFRMLGYLSEKRSVVIRRGPEESFRDAGHAPSSDRDGSPQKSALRDETWRCLPPLKGKNDCF